MTPPSRYSPVLDEPSMDRLLEALESRLRSTRPPAPERPARDKWVDRAVTWVIGIALAWATLQSDVAVLKSRVDGQDKLLTEIRQDVKELLSRVR